MLYLVSGVLKNSPNHGMTSKVLSCMNSRYRPLLMYPNLIPMALRSPLDEEHIRTMIRVGGFSIIANGFRDVRQLEYFKQFTPTYTIRVYEPDVDEYVEGIDYDYLVVPMENHDQHIDDICKMDSKYNSYDYNEFKYVI